MAVYVLKLAMHVHAGTAGLRGRMGAGTACMNALVVQQTSQGLAAYLKQHVDTEQLANGVVIGEWVSCCASCSQRAPYYAISIQWHEGGSFDAAED